MTASVGQNLPGAALPRSGSQQAGNKAGEDGPAFDDLLTHPSASTKEKTAQRAPHAPHWEKIRADFTFNVGERTATQSDESAADTDEESGDEALREKQSAETQDQTTGLRMPLLMSLHALSQSQSASQETPTEPDTAEADADPLAGDKTKQTIVARAARDAETGSGDNEQSPKIHVDRSTATRAAEGPQAAPGNAPNLFAHASAENAAASASSTSREGEPGNGGATQVEPTEAEPNGRRPSTEALKQSGASRATVVAEQNFPAPALQNASQAARDVVDAIAGNGAPARAALTAATSAQNGSPVAVPTHILKIELHPAELGTVTANLRLAGEQLSIELKPDTYEAHRRLTSDSEAIVKSLKSLGFDIDKVTILQPSIATTPSARSDTPQAGTSLGRDQSSFQPGNSSGNSDGTGGQSGRNRGDDRQQDQRPAQSAQERPGRGLFI